MPIIRVPTVKLTPGIDSYTKLLLHMDGVDNGTTFTDECGETVTVVGNACTKTGIKKFGTTSGYFTGNSGYISVDSPLDFNNSDFTIDFWLYPTGNSTTVFATGNYSWAADVGFIVSVNRDAIHFSIGRDTLFASAPINFNTWQHIAIVKTGSKQYIYADGVLKGQCDVANYGTFTNIYIGTRPDYEWNTPVYIDEFRLSNTARWTSDFTPPVCAYY